MVFFGCELSAWVRYKLVVVWCAEREKPAHILAANILIVFVLLIELKFLYSDALDINLYA